MFLIVMGTGMAAMALLGRFAAIGVFAQLHKEPIGAIGIFEGFALAAVLGICFVRISRKKESLRPWNMTAMVVHIILASANVIFWNDLFVAIGAEIPGIIITGVHLLFVLFEGWIIIMQR